MIRFNHFSLRGGSLWKKRPCVFLVPRLQVLCAVVNLLLVFIHDLLCSEKGKSGSQVTILALTADSIKNMLELHPSFLTLYVDETKRFQTEPVDEGETSASSSSSKRRSKASGDERAAAALSEEKKSRAKILQEFVALR